MTLTASSPSSDQRVVLYGIGWDRYEAMLRAMGDGHVRLTYDEGRLEIMSPGPRHEKVKTVLGRLIEAYADARGIQLEGLGSTTFRREDLLKGLEPDECYYVAHAADIIQKDELDLTVDPPPDLAIEVAISPPEVARQPIYASLGVPEIWRFDGRQLVCLHRVAGPTGAYYVASEKSLSFPNLRVADLGRFLEAGLKEGQSEAVKLLREWLATNSD